MRQFAEKQNLGSDDFLYCSIAGPAIDHLSTT